MHLCICLYMHVLILKHFEVCFNILNNLMTQIIRAKLMPDTYNQKSSHMEELT